MAKASPAAVQKALRRQQAMELRRSGATFEQIGQALEITKASAYKLVMRTLQDTRTKTAEDVETLRDLQNMRLEHALRQIAPGVSRGNLTAIDRLVKILDRQARLNGLDAPSKHALGLAGQPQGGTAPDGTPLPDGAIVNGLIAIVPARLETVEEWAKAYSPTKTTELTTPE